MTTAVRAAGLVVVAAAVAIVLDPSHRATTVRVALLALATIAAIALVHRAARRTPPALASPFDRPVRPPATRPLPLDLLRLAADADRCRHPAATGITTGVLDSTVRAVVRQRLASHHGIQVGQQPLDVPAAAALLGPATRDLLARRSGPRSAPPAPVDPDAVVSELEDL